MEAIEFHSKLGEGAMGEVHLVTRRRDGRKLALKRVAINDLDVEAKKQTLLEVALLSKLCHPNIIEYVDHFPSSDDLCILMELAPDNLYDRLERAKADGRPIPEEEILSIMAQLASALHFAHGCRVLHRDVKPANVLLTADGTLKLSDFGISYEVETHELQLGRCLRQREDGTLEGEDELPAQLHIHLKGTAAYMAPEFFDHHLHINGAMYSPASDVWALGVTMYELMTMKRPYEGNSLISVAYKLINKLSQNAMIEARDDRALSSIVSTYSAQLCACVEGMLQKRAQRRISLPELQVPNGPNLPAARPSPRPTR